VSVSPVTTGAGNLIQNGRVKLWYHQDRLGSTDFLTDNISGKVTSYVAYDDWGALTMKAILKLGLRELDLVTNYTGHPYDPVLGVYYARARMYDAADRRFMAVDWVGVNLANPNSYNRYAYVWNTPLCLVDPFGLSPKHDPQLIRNASIFVDRDKHKGEISQIWIKGNEVYVDFFEALIAYGVIGSIKRGMSGTIESNDRGFWLSYLFNDFENSATYQIHFNEGSMTDPSKSLFYGIKPRGTDIVRHLVPFDYFMKLMSCMGYKSETEYNTVLEDTILANKIKIYELEIIGEPIPYEGKKETRREKMRSFSTHEILARLLHQEDDDIAEGHTAIMWSIYNRFFNEKWPDTLYEIIMQEWQYASVYDDDALQNRSYRPHRNIGQSSYEGWQNSKKLAATLYALLGENTMHRFEKQKTGDTLERCTNIRGGYLVNNIENRVYFGSSDPGYSRVKKQGGNYFY